MACPFFYPVARHDAELWQHRHRLPLGDGFLGKCMAPGREGSVPSDPELGQCCNLGYAVECPHLPMQREADAVHFSVAQDRDNVVQVSWVLVKNHGAAGHGTLEFDRSECRWKTPHSDATMQRMAECCVESYFAKKGERFDIRRASLE